MDPTNESENRFDGAATVAAVWDRLAAIRNVSFKSHSRSIAVSGWEGEGTGAVTVEREEPATLVFREAGTWRSAEGRQFQFNNAYRWTLDTPRTCLRLEHVRFGADHPVLVFDLVAIAERRLQSASPHVCSEDCYSALLELAADMIRLDWKITGPKTDEAILYRYH
jgi:hypothetical protein